MDKKRFTAMALLVATLLSGCQSYEEQLNEELKGMPKTNAVYQSMTKDEFKDRSMDLGLIPLDDDIAETYGVDPAFTSIAVMDSKALEANTPQELLKAKEAGDKLFRVLYITKKIGMQAFLESIKKSHNNELDYQHGIYGRNSLAYISYRQEEGVYSYLGLADGHITMIDSFSLGAIKDYTEHLNLPYPTYKNTKKEN